MQPKFSAAYESNKEDCNNNKSNCSYDDHNDEEKSRIEALEIILALLEGLISEGIWFEAATASAIVPRGIIPGLVSGTHCVIVYCSLLNTFFPSAFCELESLANRVWEIVVEGAGRIERSKGTRTVGLRCGHIEEKRNAGYEEGFHYYWIFIIRDGVLLSYFKYKESINNGLYHDGLRVSWQLWHVCSLECS